MIHFSQYPRSTRARMSTDVDGLGWLGLDLPQLPYLIFHRIDPGSADIAQVDRKPIGGGK
jgi:hypothetical protein